MTHHWATTAGDLLDQLANLREPDPRALNRPYEPNYQGFAIDLLPGQRSQLLRTQGLSRKDPFLLVIHLSAEPVPVDSVPIGTNSYPIAELDWGCGGATHSALADIGRGTTLQLVADSLDLAVRYKTPLAGAAVGPRMRVSSTVVYGGTCCGKATFTDRTTADVVAPGGFTSRIPPFADSVIVGLSAPGLLRAGAISLLIESSPDVAFTTAERLEITAAEYGSKYLVPFRLWAEANFVRVSVAGAGATGIFLIYNLGL